MTAKSRDLGAFVMVSMGREDETVSKIMEILEPLGIPIEVVGRGRQLRRTPSVVFRVPHHRVAETLLALDLQGFPDVLAYQSVDGLPGVTESTARKRVQPGTTPIMPCEVPKGDIQRDHGDREPAGGPSSGSNGRGVADPERGAEQPQQPNNQGERRIC